MSGHNKWTSIKHKKEKTDAQKGKIFTKIGREIAIAVREGGSADPASNGKLRDVIAKAKASNMPNDNITRSIKRASGEGGGASYKEVTYEGYAHGGVAVIAEIVTDNANRSAAEIRHIFDKSGGSLGTSGSVTYMFDRLGVIELDNVNHLEEEELMMMALDAGASDVEVGEDVAIVYTDPNEFSAVREKLEGMGCAFISAERRMIAKNTVEVSDREAAAKIQRLLDMLEDNDDVQNVFHNAELPDGEDEGDSL